MRLRGLWVSVFLCLSGLGNADPVIAQADDLAVAQDLYTAIAENFQRPFVEVQVGSLAGGGRFARVWIMDSLLFVADSGTQVAASQEVAAFVREKLAWDRDLKIIRVGWKGGTRSTSVTSYDFPVERLGLPRSPTVNQ